MTVETITVSHSVSGAVCYFHTFGNREGKGTDGPWLKGFIGRGWDRKIWEEEGNRRGKSLRWEKGKVVASNALV